MTMGLREPCSLGPGATALQRGVALLFLGLIAVLSTPWCSETWPYLNLDVSQVSDLCEARVISQDESPGVVFVTEKLMVIGLRVRCPLLLGS